MAMTYAGSKTEPAIRRANGSTRGWRINNDAVALAVYIAFTLPFLVLLLILATNLLP
jgi:hypothetical protein